jgi:hypothetical protein
MLKKRTSARLRTTGNVLKDQQRSPHSEARYFGIEPAAMTGTVVLGSAGDLAVGVSRFGAIAENFC